MKRLHLIELEGLNIADLMTIKDREPNTTITVGGIDFYVDADQDILSTDGQGLLYFDHEDIEDIIFDLRSKNRIPAIRRRLEALKEALNSGHRLFVGGKNVDSFFTLKRETNISNEMVDMFDDGGKLPSFNNCQIMIVSGGNLPLNNQINASCFEIHHR